MVYQSIKTGARVAQWVRLLDLTTHTSLSPIFASNMCIHIIRSNRVSKFWLNDVFVSIFAALNKRHTTFAKLWLGKKMHSINTSFNQSLLTLFNLIICIHMLLVNIGDRLVWVVRSNNLTDWATRAPVFMLW